MTARTLTILNRFPLHIAATDPGKRFHDTVNGLAESLDVLSRQVGAVRGGHRLAEAPTIADLLGLAGIHGLSTAALQPVRLRLQALAAAAAATPPDPEVIGALVSLPAAALTALGNALAAAARQPTRHQPSLNLQRTVVTGVIAAHVVGNATPDALLTAAASYLGLAVTTINHTEDRWWHLAECGDRVRIASLVSQRDVLALEENPFHAADLVAVDRTHGQRFRVLRGGLDDVDVTVRVKGLGSHTVRPMVVHLDAGRGLVFEATVPDGQELLFTSSGQVTLAGADVTGSAWTFTGAVFASATEALPVRPPQRGWTSEKRGAAGDFQFADADAIPAADTPEADRLARFVVTAPLADAPAPTAAFPHGAPTVGPLRLPVGQSAWACFVRVAHFAATPTDPVVPRTSAGRFDASVFADDTHPALSVGFSWEEREPFAVRVVLPRRFARLDDDAGTKLRQPLRVLLDRHRAAGVDVRVEYADPRWSLGGGVLRTTTDNPLGTVLDATELWPDGTQQP